MVKGLAAWMRHLCKLASKEGCVDSQHPVAFGFSAGAYCLTELLSCDEPELLFGVALGGLHGHGQPDTDGIKEARRQTRAVDCFESYLRRVRRHVGVPGGIFCFHHPEDKMCPLRYAQPVIDVLDHQQ